MLEWFAEPENKHFAAHVIAMCVLAFAAEYVAPGWSIVSFPAIILLAASHFMWNYPVKAIKAHGLFSGYLIELRLLWLVIIGILFEFLALRWVESKLNLTLASVAILVGLAIAFAAHSHLQNKIVESRGFK